MDHHSYRDSDSEEYRSRSENESDNDNYWDNLAIEKEISRGTKLREAKPRKYIIQRAYDAVNIDFAAPFCTSNKKIRETSPCKYIEIRTNPCTPRSFSPNEKASSRSQTYSPITNKKSKPSTPQTRPKVKRCSMRIAELAVPSKRICIETWREKWNVLPGFMVDRLKQQVMDQTPVVHIPDAIHCFKRGKNRSSEKNNYESWKKIENVMETRTLCAMFAHKVAEKLITPINITLNPQLERISKVVANNIADIMKNGKNIPMDKLSKHRVLVEIANKVTLWISTVLDDLSDKLLEEDLRAQKGNSRRLKKDVHLVTLIEKIINEDSSELEEEEGPVLDFIDDLVDNVMDICDQNSSDITEYGDTIPDNDNKDINMDQQHDIILSSDSIENNSFDTCTNEQNEEIFKDTNEIVDDKNVIENGLIELRVSSETNDKLMGDNSILEDFNVGVSFDYFRNEINNIVDNFDMKLIYENLDDKEQNHNKLAQAAEVNVIGPDKGTLNIDELHFGINTDIQNIEETNTESPEIEFVEDLNIENMQVPLTTDVQENVELDGKTNVSIYSSESFTKPIIELGKEKLQNGLSYEIDEFHKTANTNLSDSDDDLLIAPALEDYENLENGETDSAENVNEVEGDPQVDIQDFTDNIDNVSEVFQIHSEESSDDKNKKVKFSRIDMVTQDDAALFTVSSNETMSEDISNEQEQVSWKFSSDNVKPLMMGPPNELLLSNADELWPGDIPTPTFKVSEKASRSITSLGKILETDEKIMTSPDNISYLEQITHKSTVQDTVIEDKNDKDAEILSITNNPKIKNTNITSVDVRKSPILDLKQVESCNLPVLQEEITGNNILAQVKNMTDKTKQTAKNETNILTINASEESKSKKSNAIPFTNIETLQDKLVDASEVVLKVGDHIQHLNVNNKYIAHSEENIILETVKDNIKVLTRTKFNYKVNPNTAHSWVPCGQGEPSEHSFSNYKGTQNNKKCNYQKWCNDLNQGFVNLEIWNNWIDNVCKMITYLEQTQDIKINRRDVEKNWMKLKKSISKDAILWNKLNQRAHERLKIYKKRVNSKKSKCSLFTDDERQLTAEPRNFSKEYILEKMFEFDSLCLRMHRLITSTEYCLKCKCKNNEKKSRISYR